MSRFESTIAIKLTGEMDDLRRQYTNLVREMQSKVIPIRFRAQAEEGGGGTFSGGAGGGAYTPRSYPVPYRPASNSGGYPFAGNPYTADLSRSEDRANRITESVDEDEGIGGGGGRRGSIGRRAALMGLGRTLGFPGLGMLGGSGVSGGALAGVGGALAALYAVHEALRTFDGLANFNMAQQFGGAQQQLAAAQQMLMASPITTLQQAGVGALMAFGQNNYATLWQRSTALYANQQAQQQYQINQGIVGNTIAESRQDIEATSQWWAAKRIGILNPFDKQRQQAEDDYKIATMSRNNGKWEIEAQLAAETDPAQIAILKHRLFEYGLTMPKMRLAATEARSRSNQLTDWEETQDAQGRMYGTAAIRASTDVFRQRTTESEIAAAQANVDAKYVPVLDGKGDIVSLMGVSRFDKRFTSIRDQYDAASEAASTGIKFNRGVFELGADIGLSARANAIKAGLARDPVGMQIAGILGQGNQEMLNFESQGFDDQAKKSQQNTVGALALLRQQYMDAFRATSFDSRQIQAGNPKDVQDPQSVMNELSQAIKDTNSKLDEIKQQIADLVSN